MDGELQKAHVNPFFLRLMRYSASPYNNTKYIELEVDPELPC